MLDDQCKLPSISHMMMNMSEERMKPKWVYPCRSYDEVGDTSTKRYVTGELKYTAPNCPSI